MAKLIPYLWPKQLKNHTLWGHTYLHTPCKGVREYPTPPRGGDLGWTKKTTSLNYYASISGFPLGTTIGAPTGTQGHLSKLSGNYCPRVWGKISFFVHRDCSPWGRSQGFVGQRYTLFMIPGCCSRCSLHALTGRDLGLELTKFCWHACLRRLGTPAT